MPAEFGNSELPPGSLTEKVIDYKAYNACWYGHIFKRRRDAETARAYSLWHEPDDRIVKVWGGWKLMRRL